MLQRRIFITASIFIVSVVPLVTGAQTTGTGLVPCTNNCDFNNLIVLIERVMNFLIYQVATPIAAIMFAVAGYMYLTAGDSESKVHHAHEIFISVLWGFGIMIIAWALVSFILSYLAPGYSLLEAPAPSPAP